MCQSGGFAGKLYRMEVDEIEYIAHIDIVQVDGQRVVGIWGSFTVDDDVLLVVFDRQVVDREVVLVIIDACRFDMPYAVANGDGRGLDVDVGRGHAVMVVVEVGLGIDDSGEVALAVVLKGEQGMQLVVLGQRVDVPIGAAIVLAYLLQMGKGFEHVIWRGKADVASLIAAFAIIERGQVEGHFYLTVAVSHAAFQGQGALEI